MISRHNFEYANMININDLPNPHIVYTELYLWEVKLIYNINIPTSIHDTFKEADTTEE